MELLEGQISPCKALKQPSGLFGGHLISIVDEKMRGLTPTNSMVKKKS